MTQAAKSKVDDLKTRASDLASDAGETIKDTAQSVKAAAAETVSSARETVKDTADDLGRRGREAGDAAVRKTRETGRWIKDNPVATGLMVMAAGAAIGSVLTARRGGPDAGEKAADALEHEAKKKEAEKDGLKGADRFDQLADKADPKKTATKTVAGSSPARTTKSRGVTATTRTPNGATESKTSVGTSQT